MTIRRSYSNYNNGQLVTINREPQLIPTSVRIVTKYIYLPNVSRFGRENLLRDHKQSFKAVVKQIEAKKNIKENSDESIVSVLKKMKTDELFSYLKSYLKKIFILENSLIGNEQPGYIVLVLEPDHLLRARYSSCSHGNVDILDIKKHIEIEENKTIDMEKYSEYYHLLSND